MDWLIRDPDTRRPRLIPGIYFIARRAVEVRQGRKWVKTNRAILAEMKEYGCFLKDVDLGFVTDNPDAAPIKTD